MPLCNALYFSVVYFLNEQSISMKLSYNEEKLLFMVLLVHCSELDALTIWSERTAEKTF